MSEYLPQDIVMKILARLPPKPLIKFRCVSKSWYSMISSPQFISLHTQHALLLSNSISPSHTNQMIVRRYSKPLTSEVTDNAEFSYDQKFQIEYPFLFDVRSEYLILGSSNDLICLFEVSFGRHVDSIQLWNPAIKRKLKLPVSQTSFKKCMAEVLGFGFDARNNDYKVVRICYEYLGYGYFSPLTVEVYSLSRGNWHTVSNCVVMYGYSQVFINGNVHWIGYKDMGKSNKRKNSILSFNPSLEMLDEMQLPEALENERPHNLCGVDFGGSLAVVRYDNERLWSSKSCCIWVMKEYGDAESWSRDYDVVLEGGIGEILGLRENGDVLVTSSVGGLVSHSCLTGKCVDLVSFGTKRPVYAGPYFESLVLLSEARQMVESDEELVSRIEDDEF